MPRRTTTRLAAIAAAATLSLPTLAHAEPAPGASGVGDPYFPGYGNGGYDVVHYDLLIDYGVASRELVGTATIDATATQDLSSFNLDLKLDASSISVDGTAATFSQSGQELTVIPAAPILQGRRFVVEVSYAGDPAGATGSTLGGWFLTSDGAVAVGEPEVAAVWFPSNDHPIDKATFDLRIRVPSAKKAISNGILVGRTEVGSDTEWHWRMDQPMATYLATVVIGDYRISRGRSRGGVPYLNAVTTRLSDERRVAVERSLAATPRIVDFFSSQFGPYPFDIAGGTAVNASFGFALENQTRPNYSKVFFGRGRAGVNTEVVAHEQAHMWWGNSVSVERWRDIWLNEGFATWSSWLWAGYESEGRVTPNRIFADYYASLADAPGFWTIRIANPGPDSLFDGAVYVRGAMAVQALRNRIGAAQHRKLLKTWARILRDGNGRVEDFETLAERISGHDLDRFFREWLHQADRPRPSRALGFPGTLLPRAVERRPAAGRSTPRWLVQSLRHRM